MARRMLKEKNGNNAKKKRKKSWNYRDEPASRLFLAFVLLFI